MPESDSAESAVRLYLLYLEDPAKLVDQAEVAKAEATVAAANDPIDKLQAIAKLEQVRQADGDEVLKDFITHAKGYADSQSIPVTAFHQLNVPADVLRQAGFDVRRISSTHGARTRAPRASLEDIKAAALTLPKQFTLSDVVEKAGSGSPATIRKAIEELVADGKARKVGPKENYAGRGRAPIVYELL